jgi:endo-alpha-1,4-polygalactosaminidase (GH114 family)
LEGVILALQRKGAKIMRYLFYTMVFCAFCSAACGGDDEEAGGDNGSGNGASTGGLVCERSEDEDGDCASMAGTPAFFFCETEEHRAPSDACKPLGDTGDYCCPEEVGTENGGEVTGDWWQPEAGVTWDWQLSEPLDLTYEVEIYDVDWETEQDQLDELLARGVKLICYVSVGTYEEWRSDAEAYPESVIGPLWPEWDEYFVDIRSDAVRDIVTKRMDVCAAKGFHGFEPDNMDVFELEDDSGFPLTEESGLAYAEWLAEEAHARGLAIVQKNASSLTHALVHLYDGALTEDCFADDWCEEVMAYAEAGKPVLMAEYTDTGVDFEAACAFGDESGSSPILKDRDLTNELETCP